MTIIIWKVMNIFEVIFLLKCLNSPFATSRGLNLLISTAGGIAVIREMTTTIPAYARRNPGDTTKARFPGLESVRIRKSDIISAVTFDNGIAIKRQMNPKTNASAHRTAYVLTAFDPSNCLVANSLALKFDMDTARLQ